MMGKVGNNSHFFEALLVEYKYLRDEDQMIKNRMQTIIVQAVIFVGIVAWFGIEIKEVSSYLTSFAFLLFIPVLCSIVIIILLSCHLRTNEINIHAVRVEEKIHTFLKSYKEMPIEWMQFHMCTFQPKRIFLPIYRADGSAAGIFFMLVIIFSLFIGNVLSPATDKKIKIIFVSISVLFAIIAFVSAGCAAVICKNSIKEFKKK